MAAANKKGAGFPAPSRTKDLIRLHLGRSRGAGSRATAGVAGSAPGISRSTARCSALTGAGAGTAVLLFLVLLPGGLALICGSLATLV
jgi:hypothetical protein